MEIRGVYYDGFTSASQPAVLRVEGQKVILTIESSEPESSVKVVNMNDVQVSDRIAGIIRKITFPDTSCFETKDNDAVDKYFKSHSPMANWIHFFESHKHAAMIAILSLVAISLLFYFVLLPKGAHYAAMVTPQSAKVAIDESFIATYSKMKLLGESKLEVDSKNKVQSLFETVKTEYPDLPLNFRLIHSPGIGPNAFALPGGTIHVTDSLVKLAENDEEILGVLYHETAHVALNHSLEAVIQRAGISLFLVAVIGMDDITALPMLILSSAYSREDEREADYFAAEKMKSKGIPPVALANLLERMSLQRKPSKFDVDSSVLQSHPMTKERTKYLKAFK